MTESPKSQPMRTKDLTTEVLDDAGIPKYDSGGNRYPTQQRQTMYYAQRREQLQAQMTPEDRKKNKKQNWIIVGSVAGVFIFIVAWISIAQSSGPDEAAAITVCHSAVQSQLKHPSSADFSWGYDTTKYDDGTVSKMSGTVSAKNDFGGELEVPYLCKLKVDDAGDYQVLYAKINE